MSSWGIWENTQSSKSICWYGLFFVIFFLSRTHFKEQTFLAIMAHLPGIDVGTYAKIPIDPYLRCNTWVGRPGTGWDCQKKVKKVKKVKAARRFEQSFWVSSQLRGWPARIMCRWKFGSMGEFTYFQMGYIGVISHYLEDHARTNVSG